MRRVLIAPALVLGLCLSVLAPLAPAQAAYQSTTPQATWVPNGTVYAVAVTTDRVYLGGEFTRVANLDSGASLARTNLVALDRATGAPVTGWRADANAPVRALAVGNGGTLFVGGDFTTVQGENRSRLAAVDAAGSVVAGFSPSANGRVWDLVADGGALFVAGQFTRLDGTYRPGVVRVDATSGVLAAGFDATVGGGKVQALAKQGSVLYLGGTFSSVGGQPHAFVASVDAATGADTGWTVDPICDNCRVRDLAVSYDDVVAAIGGEPGGWATAWSASTGERHWLRHADGEVQAVALSGSTAFFGGHFAVRFGGLPRSQLAAVDVTTGIVDPFVVATKGSAVPGVWALNAQNDALRVGGSTRLAKQPYRNYLVLTDPQVTPGPTHVALTLKLNGCGTCQVRLAQGLKGRTTVWKTTWKRASKGIVTFQVPLGRTYGMTAQLRAPWEGATKTRTEVVVAYRGKPTGTTVSAVMASRQKRGSACFAGTARATLTWSVGVRRTSVPGKHGPTSGSRAWILKTREDIAPTRATARGRASTAAITRCG